MKGWASSFRRWVASLAGLATLVVAGAALAGGTPVPMISTCGPTPPASPCVTRWTCLDGAWEPTYRAAGTTCNDGNACTTADKCDGAGGCSGTAITCTASDQCHVAGTCNSATGVCTNPPKTNGTACNDGNLCTQNDTCQSGICTGNPVQCATPDQCHTAGSCNPATGICSAQGLKPSGTPCSDGNLCTYGETCTNGVCGGGTPKSCDPNARCGPEACNGTSSCTVTPVAIDDGDPCTADACDPVHGVTHTIVAGCSQAAGGPPIVAPYPDASPPGGMPMAPGLGVDESSGTLQYNYRFDIPKARGRFQPGLALSYKHTGTRDFGTGIGWTVEGPMKRSWELDPATGAYTREWVDLGGARELMVVGPGGKKRNESGPLVLIQAATGNGYVDVAGNFYDFGSPTGMQVQTVTDVFGNETRYEYVSGYPDMLKAISYDKFVGTFGAEYATRIELGYDALPPGVTLDVDVSTGAALRRTQKLSSVVVKNHAGVSLNNWVSTIQYKLEYATRGHRLLLTKVTRQAGQPIGGTGNFTEEPPTVFGYDTASSYSMGAGTEINLPATVGNADVEWVDLDGDGRPDLVWTLSSISNGTQYYTQYWARNVTLPTSSGVSFAPTQVVPGSWVVTTHAWMDFDGDGIADRLEVGTPTCGAGILSIRKGQKTIIGTNGPVMLSFASPTCVSMTPGAPNLYSGITRTDSYGRVIGKLVDVNGDGVLDWLEPWSTNQTTGGWRVYHGYRTATGWAFGTPLNRQLVGYDFTGGAPPLSGGRGLTVPPGYVPGVAPTQFKSADLYSAIDVNGDGIPDFAQAVATGGGPTRWAVWYLTRSGFSSVGAGDLAFTGSSTGFTLSSERWITGLLNPNGAEAECVPSTWVGCGGFDGRDESRLTGMALDVDGDGLPDFLTRTEASELQVWWNHGDRFDVGSVAALPLGSVSAADVYPSINRIPTTKVCGHCDNVLYDPADPGAYPRTIPVSPSVTVNTLVNGQFVDMDGDGVLDFVQAGIPDPSTGVRAAPGGAFFRGSVGSVRLLSVKIPTGATYAATYTPSSTYDAGHAKAPRTVVATLAVSGAEVAANTSTYWYARPTAGSPWTSDGGFAFRGFEQTTVQESSYKTVRSTTWETASHVTAGSARGVVWGSETTAGGVSQPPTFDTFRAHTTTYMVKSVGSTTCLDPTDAANGASGAPYLPVPATAAQTRYVAGVTMSSTASQACGDVDDYGNPTRIAVSPDGISSYQILASYDASATCKSCPTETWTSPDGSKPSALRHSKYFYADAANAQLLQGVVGDGRLKFVSRKSGSTTWEVQATTKYFANGNPDTVTSGHILESGGALATTQQVDRKVTYDAFGLRVTKEEVVDPSVTLTTDIEYDSVSGLARKVTGPYVSGSAVPQSVRTMAYDGLGRPVAIGRGISPQQTNPVTITGAVSAVVYAPSMASPQYAKAYTFGAPVTLTCTVGGDCSASIPEQLADVKVNLAYLDGLGRTIQVRERMGGSGTSAGNPANVTQALSSGSYRVSGSVLIDGAGRTKGVLEPFYSTGYPFETYSSVAVGSRRGSYTTFDVQGRVSCALSGIYAAAVANAVACTQSDMDDANQRSSVRLTYGFGDLIGGVQTMKVTATAGNAPRGTVTSYDAGARALLVVDPTLSKTVNTYDLLGQARTSTRQGPGGEVPQTVTTTYDLLGRVTEIADPNWLASGQPASAVADAFGRGRRTMEYYSHGGVKKLSLPAVDAGGTPLRPYVTTTYGSLLRKTAMAVNEPKYVANLGWTFATRTSTFTYDTAYAGDTTTYTYVAGRMASAVNETATIAFGYDQDGTPKERDEFFTGLGSNRFGASIATANDGRAVQAQFVSPYSPTVGYSLSYDSFGRPVGVVGTNSGATQVWGTTTTAVDGNGAYDALGRIADARGYVQSNGGTVTTKRTYGAYSGQLVGQVTKLGVTALYSVGSMGYVGEKLTQMTDTGTGTAYGWAYDTGGRLVTATATANTSSGLTQNYSHSFGFTPVWNLSTANVSWNGSSTSPQGYTYSGTDQATQAPGGFQPVYALTHDGMGNVVERRVPPSQIPAETLTYTAEGYLRSIVRGTSTDEVLYYDALGNLAYRRSGTYLWFYAGEHATITGTNAACATDPCAPTAGTVKVNIHVLLAGARIATVRSAPGQTTDQAFGSVLYFHRDRQGSVVATTTTGGVLGAQYRYGPYGELDRYAGNEATAGSDLGYTGGLRLTGGLIHLRARVYDPSFRRFLQADIVDPLRYTYTNGDPTNFIDPSGRAPRDGNGRTTVLAGDAQTNAADGGEPNWCTNEQDNFCIEGVNGGLQVISTGKPKLEIGTPQFYVNIYVFWTTNRYKNRAAREPSREYLLGFAYRYALRYSQMAQSTKSESFRYVLNTTLQNLQVLLLRRISADPTLLDDPEKLGTAAFLTHVDAYDAGGFPNLRLDQKAEMLNALDAKDVFTYGIGVAARVLVPGVWMGLQNPPLPGLQPYP